MPIDVSLQFNGHNSWRATDAKRSDQFGVQNMDWITISLQAMANSALPEAVRAETRFYGSNGMLLSKVSHSFAVGTVWDKVVITVAVPALAVKAQIAMLPGPTVWWWVEAKAEEGQTATPYSINYAGQLTKMTPTGVYTGLLSVEQILVRGTQANPEEHLGERLVTIANNHITLSNYVNGRTTKITAEGVYTGEIEADKVTTGVLKSANGVSLINLDNGNFNFGSGAFTFAPASGAKMAGWEVKTDVLTKSFDVQIGPFTQADLDRVQGAILKTNNLTADEKIKYDINRDGRVSTTDLSYMIAMVRGEDGYTNPETRKVDVKIGGIDSREVISVSSKFKSYDPQKAYLGESVMSAPYTNTNRISPLSGVNDVQIDGQLTVGKVMSLDDPIINLGQHVLGADSTGLYKRINGGQKVYL